MLKEGNMVYKISSDFHDFLVFLSVFHIGRMFGVCVIT